MHDPTLRVGDAVMMKSGIKIFTGRRRDSDAAGDFMVLEEARDIKSSERVALALLDVRRGNSSTKRGWSSPGRSSFVGRPVLGSEETFDDNHRAVRFVGP